MPSMKSYRELPDMESVVIFLPDRRIRGFKQEGFLHESFANGSLGDKIDPLDIVGWMREDEVGRPIDLSIFAHEFKSIEFEECFTHKEGVERSEEDKRIEHILTTYLKQFSFGWVDPSEQPKEGEPPARYCPACGGKLSGLLASIGVGVGFEWGLVHGSGHCSGCRYPMKGHHFIHDPAVSEGEPLVTITNMFVFYMPNFLDEGGWSPPKNRDD